MAQPIRKDIQDKHVNLIKEENFRTLLIDGNSLLFHCMRDEKINVNGIHYGGIYQFLLQIKKQLEKAEFQYVYCFFDNEYSGYLRYCKYNGYKLNRDKHYNEYGLSEYMKEFNNTLKSMQEHIYNKNKANLNKSEAEIFMNENFDRERDILCECFNELFIRWYIDDITEGDDLIAYYCNNKQKNEKIIIVSGDMDLSQLLSDDIAIYNLNNKKYITNKNFKEYFGYIPENTLVKKIFCGDISDNISNIKGLSEDGFFKLMPEVKERIVTIDDIKKRAKELIDERVKNKKKPFKMHENIINGIPNKEYNGDFYEINDFLINLHNPILSNDAKEIMDNMMYAPQDPDGRSFVNLYKIIDDIGIVELNGDTRFAMFFSPFKKLVEKEKKKYLEEIC